MLANSAMPVADRHGLPRMPMSSAISEENGRLRDVRRGPSRSATVDVVTDYDAFIALEAEWNDAVERARVPHPFLSHEWVRTWWDAFSTPTTRLLYPGRARQRPRDGDRALRCATRRAMYGIPARRVRFIHNDHTPRTDMIIADDADASYQAIWRALRTDREGWDVLLLGQLERDSKTHQAFREFAAAERLRTGTWRSSDSPYLPITGTWDAYLNSLPAKFRSNLRNRLSRLTKIGPVAARDPD